MKPRFTKQRNHAWSWLELLVVLVLVAVLFWLLLVMLLPTRVARHRRNHGSLSQAQRINCVNNLKQVGLALRIWEGDNNGKYPMQVAVANGGGREWIEVGDVGNCLLVASNALATPRILKCPADAGHTAARNFDHGLNNSNISYFFGVDVTNEDNPGTVLDGDDNLAISGVPTQPGVVDFSSNSPVSWTAVRHKYAGNIGLADGSVWEMSTLELQKALIQSGLATNRLAIP